MNPMSDPRDCHGMGHTLIAILFGAFRRCQTCRPKGAS